MSRKTLAMAVLVAVVASPAAAACAREAPATTPRAEPVETSAGHAPAAPPAVEVLRAWDAQRSRAWARGDPRLLAALYAPDSVARQRDRSMLGAWLTRGLVVRGLRTQLLSVREVSRSRSAWTLRVTDRLVGGVAVGAGVRRPLPVDAATTRTVVLRRLDGRWVVASVA